MEQFFFSRAGARLLGMRHPAQGARRAKLILCDPLYQDASWAHRHLWHFAQAASGRGLDVMRFTWFGFGDSDGDEEEIGVETLASDLIAALDEQDARAGAGPAVLVGLRAGGHVAGLVAERLPDRVSALAHWDPVAHLGEHIATELRMTITTQTALLKQVVRTREVILENVRQGRTQENVVEGIDWGNIEGYRLSPSLVRDADRSDLAASAGRYRGPVLLCDVRPRPKPKPGADLQRLAEAYGRAGCRVTVADVQEIPFWRNNNAYTQRADQLCARTLTWLDETIPSS